MAPTCCNSPCIWLDVGLSQNFEPPFIFIQFIPSHRDTYGKDTAAAASSFAFDGRWNYSPMA